MKLALCLLLLVACVVHNYAYPGLELEKLKEKVPGLPKGNPLDKDKELEKVAGGAKNPLGGGEGECEEEPKPKQKKKHHYKKNDDEEPPKSDDGCDEEEKPKKNKKPKKQDKLKDLFGGLPNPIANIEKQGLGLIKDMGWGY